MDGSFGAIHSKSYAHGSYRKEDKEFITVDGEEKTFVEEDIGYQLTESNRRMTFTDKDIAVGDGTTYGDIVAMFGAEPTEVDADANEVGEIYTYRNSTVTVGFVFAFPRLVPELEYKYPELKYKYYDELTEEQKNSLPLIAVYMWLND